MRMSLMTKLNYNRTTPQPETPEIIYLMVSYKQREDAKNLGAKWDPNLKLWYSWSTHPNLKKMREFMHKDDIGVYL